MIFSIYCYIYVLSLILVTSFVLQIQYYVYLLNYIKIDNWDEFQNVITMYFSIVRLKIKPQLLLLFSYHFFILILLHTDYENMILISGPGENSRQRKYKDNKLRSKLCITCLNSFKQGNTMETANINTP